MSYGDKRIEYRVIEMVPNYVPSHIGSDIVTQRMGRELAKMLDDGQRHTVLIQRKQTPVPPSIANCDPRSTKFEARIFVWPGVVNEMRVVDLPPDTHDIVLRLLHNAKKWFIGWIRAGAY